MAASSLFLEEIDRVYQGRQAEQINLNKFLFFFVLHRILKKLYQLMNFLSIWTSRNWMSGIINFKLFQLLMGKQMDLFH